jgi:hypothetical protein
MATHVDAWVVFAGAAVLLLTQLVSALDLRAIITRLKMNHHVLWLRMECPSWWFLTITLGRGAALDIPGSNRINIISWLSNKEYLLLNDSVLTRFAQRQRIANRVGVTIALLVLGYGLLRHYGVVGIADAVV